MIAARSQEASSYRRPRRSRHLGPPSRYSSYRSGAAPLRPTPRRASRDFVRRWARQSFLLGLLIFAQLLFLFSTPLRAQSVWTAGNQRVTRDQIIAHAGVAPGDFLWRHSQSGIAKRVEELHELKDVHVSYGLPGRVEIQVSERKPQFQVASNEKKPRWFAVDNEGVVLHPLRNLDPALPRLFLEQPLKPGERIHLSNLYTLAAAAKVIEKAFPDRVWYYRLDSRGGLSFRTFSHGHRLDVEVGNLDSLPRKMSELKVLRDHVLGTQPVAAVDLRFSSPSVSFLVPPGSVVPAVPAKATVKKP